MEESWRACQRTGPVSSLSQLDCPRHPFQLTVLQPETSIALARVTVKEPPAADSVYLDLQKRRKSRVTETTKLQE